MPQDGTASTTYPHPQAAIDDQQLVMCSLCCVALLSLTGQQPQDRELADLAFEHPEAFVAHARRQGLRPEYWYDQPDPVCVDLVRDAALRFRSHLRLVGGSGVAA
jgi:hypothetical protein